MINPLRIPSLFLKLFAWMALGFACTPVNAVDRYVSLTGGHTPPFTDWAGAATNIQDAIDVAAAGDVIFVTNGVYSTGGKVMAGDLTNRVALDKAIVVKSMNGASETIIKGQWDAMDANGPGAVRCAWLTNGAVLNGFTLVGGATRTAGDYNGGGVWCASTNEVVANCIVIGNTALNGGGGSYYGTLINCLLVSNTAGTGGGGSYNSTLINCTLTANHAGTHGGGAFGGTLYNCIVWSNTSLQSDPNYYLGTLRYSCASPLASGSGNIAIDPQLLTDNVHIAATSPCRTNGNALYTSGTDIDGQIWADPPSMGCDQWQPQPVLLQPPQWQPGAGTARAVVWTAFIAGQEPFDCWWIKDGLVIEDGPHYGGVHTSDLWIRGFGPEDAGAYQVVASNAFGMATSAVARVVVHCVDAAATASLVPYTNWVTAATTIQTAIDAAAAGSAILVTNGIYASGGKVMAGDLTNRVALDKAVTVMSVNGASDTIIQGQWDPKNTNGPGAIRCAWLTNGAALHGFTLRGGATRSLGDANTLCGGGGAWCVSTNGIIANCILTANSAGDFGGGSYSGTLNNCALTGNTAYYGAGGAYAGSLNNCTLTGNMAYYGAGGSFYNTLNNCIVWGNASSTSGSNYYFSRLYYTCASPLAPGSGNIALDPQLVDGAHVASTSPCRGAGSALYTTGFDLDGETWKNPPSMGCDEIGDATLTGPISVAITAPQTGVVINRLLELTGLITGRVERLEWSFGDGAIATNAGFKTSHIWTNMTDYTVTLTAYNADHPEGISTNILIHIVPLELPVILSGGMNKDYYQLEFSCQGGVVYLVECATNLVPPVYWQGFSMQSGLGESVKVQDLNATNTSRFYRVRVW